MGEVEINIWSRISLFWPFRPEQTLKWEGTSVKPDEDPLGEIPTGDFFTKSMCVRNWTRTWNEIRYEQNWLIVLLLKECEYYHELMKWRSWVDECNLWTKQRCCGEVSGRRKVSVVKDGSREKLVGWAVYAYMWHAPVSKSCGRTGYTGPTGRTGPSHDPPDPSAYSTHTALPWLAS